MLNFDLLQCVASSAFYLTCAVSRSKYFRKVCGGVFWCDLNASEGKDVHYDYSDFALLSLSGFSSLCTMQNFLLKIIKFLCTIVNTTFAKCSYSNEFKQMNIIPIVDVYMKAKTLITWDEGILLTSCI